MKTAEEEKIRLLRRILVSYNDFKQAAEISSHILEAKLHRDYPEKDRELLQALNCAMIIAYARPFSGNSGSKTTLKALPARFLSVLTSDERALHQVVLQDRNQCLAHSDHCAWNLRLSFVRPSGHAPMLVPLHHDVRAPLDKRPTLMLKTMAHKLMEAVSAERSTLEKELADALPTLRLEDNSVTGEEQAMRYGGWL